MFWRWAAGPVGVGAGAATGTGAATGVGTVDGFGWLPDVPGLGCWAAGMSCSSLFEGFGRAVICSWTCESGQTRVSSTCMDSELEPATGMGCTSWLLLASSSKSTVAGLSRAFCMFDMSWCWRFDASSCKAWPMVEASGFGAGVLARPGGWLGSGSVAGALARPRGWLGSGSGAVLARGSGSGAARLARPGVGVLARLGGWLGSGLSPTASSSTLSLH